MNETFMELINQYLLPAFGTALIGICGWVGNKIVNYLKVKQLEKLAKNAVMFVEQTCKDLHGQEKLTKAMDKLSKAALSKGIGVTTEELEFYIESAVGEFSKAFDKSTD